MVFNRVPLLEPKARSWGPMTAKLLSNIICRFHATQLYLYVSNVSLGGGGGCELGG